MVETIKEFLKTESAGGIFLIIATALALLLANSPLSGIYDSLLNATLQIRIETFNLEKPLILWINDGLMAVFFFLIGLELKRELIDGELSDPSKLLLPAMAALGGMIVPAFIYAGFNFRDPVAIQGWAIPTATDIAFALGILSLLGNRVPVALKVFLASLAIIDDIGAILIIAIFYTADLSFTSLLAAAACLVVLALMNRRGVDTNAAYILVGVVLWVSVLKSGVHATLAGVALAMFIPYASHSDPDRSPLRELEHDLHSSVVFVILPVFAFANAGVPLQGISAAALFSSVPLGIILGLCAGKLAGVYLTTWIGVRLNWAPLPDGMDLKNLLGLSLLCGVGFTMSLFIASLAFEQGGLAYSGSERLGVLIGSSLSGIAGYLVLRATLPRAR
jgi:NhaA family Na+:H+ antiporter